MTKIQKFKIAILLFVFYFLLSGVSVQAVNLFFEAKSQEFTPGEEFLVNVFFNIEGESINAAEGKVIFPEELLEVKEIRDGNSIINFWLNPVRNEVSNGVERSGAIIFAGIIPGGYQETKGFLFSVVFRAKVSGSGAIEIRDTKVLLHDGRGTPAPVKVSDFLFSITAYPEVVPQEPAQVKDSDPPEKFKPEIAQSQEMFDGKYFLAFATQDKGSGIDHYEIREGLWGEFRIAESPYLLENQELDKKIFVKAVDKNGNEWIETFYPPHWRPWYESYWILGILILGVLVILYFVRKMVWAKRIR